VRTFSDKKKEGALKNFKGIESVDKGILKL